MPLGIQLTLASRGNDHIPRTRRSRPDGPSLKSWSILVAFVWELTKETIDLSLGCLQGGQLTRGNDHISHTRRSRPDGP